MRKVSHASAEIKICHVRTAKPQKISNTMVSTHSNALDAVNDYYSKNLVR